MQPEKKTRTYTPSGKAGWARPVLSRESKFVPNFQYDVFIGTGSAAILHGCLLLGQRRKLSRLTGAA